MEPSGNVGIAAAGFVTAQNVMAGFKKMAAVSAGAKSAIKKSGNPKVRRVISSLFSSKYSIWKKNEEKIILVYQRIFC